MGEENVQYHKWLKDDTIKVKLMKMSKGYQWELSCEGTDADTVIVRLTSADSRLKEIFKPDDSI